MRNKQFYLVISVFKKHILNYTVPLNLSFVWCLGSLLGLCIALQITSGIFLSFFYNSDIANAFASVERMIMRDIRFGWFIRYVHVNVASFIFLFLYIHIGKAFYFRSYTRVKLWLSGCFIFIIVMLAAFSGYVLVWGQMSLWAATVITNLFSAVPLIGPYLVEWIWGGFTVSKPTLVRFFSIHFLAGLIAGFLAIIHIIILHEEGASNPTGIQSHDNTNFAPLFLNKDLFWMIFFFFFLSYFLFFKPSAFMHPANFERANPFLTPKSIVPEWYFLPFYTILKAVPNKIGGILAMGLSVLLIILLPVLDKNTFIKAPKIRLLWKFFFWSFIFNFIFLGWLGEQPAEELFIILGQLSTIYYFLSLVVIIPIIGEVETLILRQTQE